MVAAESDEDILSSGCFNVIRMCGVPSAVKLGNVNVVKG